MFTSVCQFGLGVAVAFSWNYYIFVVLRFLLAMVSAEQFASCSSGGGSEGGRCRKQTALLFTFCRPSKMWCKRRRAGG